MNKFGSCDYLGNYGMFYLIDVQALSDRQVSPTSRPADSTLYKARARETPLWLCRFVLVIVPVSCFSLGIAIVPVRSFVVFNPSKFLGLCVISRIWEMDGLCKVTGCIVLVAIMYSVLDHPRSVASLQNITYVHHFIPFHAWSRLNSTK